MRLINIGRSEKLRWGWSALIMVLIAGCTRQEAKVQPSGDDKPAVRAEAAPAGVNNELVPVAHANVSDDEWGTIKGRIVYGKADIPPVDKIMVGAGNAVCLATNPTADKANGTIDDEKLLVNPKNHGLKNVFVYILVEPGKKIPIHPKLQDFPPKVEIDQPTCMFWPRALAMREGQIFDVKNSSTIQHNIRWSVESGGGSQIIAPGGHFEIKDLKAQRLPAPLECNIHGWMKGRLGIFTHPYFAITDADGKFEIKDAPVGTHKLMIYHENIGYLGGSKGRNGHEHTIKSGVNDLKELKMS